MNDMSTLTLDYNASKALLFYMCYQNDIKRPMYLSDEDIAYYFFGLNPKRGYDLELHYDFYEKQMLANHFERFDCLYSILTLYDEIYLSPVFQGNISAAYNYDKDQLAELGLIYNTNRINLPPKSVIDDTIGIMHLYEKEILSYYANDDTSRFVDILNHNGFERYFEIKGYKDIFNETFLDSLKRKIPFYDIFNLGGILNARNAFDAGEMRGYRYLDACFLAISSALCKPRSTFYSSMLSIPNLKRIDYINCKELDQYIVHADFSQGLSVVPKAENYQDIVELRKDPNLQSFRKVFGTWVNYFVEGDIESFEKIRKDVVKANENLCRLKKYEKVLNSPLYCLLSVLLGAAIPKLSYILGGVGVISAIVEPQIEFKNRWVNMPAFHNNMERYYRNEHS